MRHCAQHMDILFDCERIQTNLFVRLQGLLPLVEQHSQVDHVHVVRGLVRPQILHHDHGVNASAQAGRCQLLEHGCGFERNRHLNSDRCVSNILLAQYW